MIACVRLAEQLRELGFVHMRGDGRTEVYRIPATTRQVVLPVREYLEDAYAGFLLTQAGMASEAVADFIRANQD
jgi:hypothetical protein